jgi:hypothetical protein
LVTESMLLGCIGGALGLALAYWSTQALIAARPADLPRIDDIRTQYHRGDVHVRLSLVTSLILDWCRRCKSPTGTCCWDFRRVDAAAAAAGAACIACARRWSSRKWRWP